MTSPITEVRVECPRCGTEYEDWFRASLNLNLDDFDAEYQRQASTATCPSCGHVVEFDTLVFDGDVFTFNERDEMIDDPSFPQPRRPKEER